MYRPPFFLLAYLVSLCLLINIFVRCSDDSSNEKFFQLSANDIRGKPVKFNKYRGQVLLIVNVATYCGFTRTGYQDLVKMQDILGHDKLFTILGFPCNQFGEQEPDSNREIEEFVNEIYKVNFPLFSKIEVAGEGAHPVYKYLKEKTTSQPSWNFFKYLVGHKGSVLNYWEPEVPLEEIFPAVEEAILAAKKEQRSSANEL